jgi:hypothetical protein
LGERFCSRGIETYDLSIVKVYFYDQFIWKEDWKALSRGVTIPTMTDVDYLDSIHWWYWAAWAEKGRINAPFIF